MTGNLLDTFGTSQHTVVSEQIHPICSKYTGIVANLNLQMIKNN